MKYEEFRRQLGKAGLTNKSFAALLGLQTQSINNLKTKGVVPNQLALIATFIADYKDKGLDFMSIIDMVIENTNNQSTLDNDTNIPEHRV